MSLVFKKMVDFLGRQPSDVVIRFAHEEPIGQNGFRDLNINVMYNAGENSISLTKAVGDEPNAQYVKCLSDQAISLCEERLMEHSQQQHLTRTEQVKTIVLNWEAQQSPTLCQVAESPRTLTRSLTREGESFQRIIDQQKFYLATKLLTETKKYFNNFKAPSLIDFKNKIDHKSGTCWGCLCCIILFHPWPATHLKMRYGPR